MASSWATSGWIKIERAKEHVGNLAAEITAFLKTDPYGAVGQDEVETGDWVIRATVRNQPPLRWGAIAGDAVHNLGSTLDILYGTVFGFDRKSNFPTFASADEHRRRFRGHVKPSRQAAMDLLKATKAYPGGNDPLRWLDLLNNEDKHHTLVPAYGSIGVTQIDFSFGFRNFPDIGEVPPTVMGLRWAEPACPVKHGTELHRVKAQARQGEFDMYPKFPLEIAFGESGVVYGKPMLATLNKFVEAVEATTQSFVYVGLLP